MEATQIRDSQWKIIQARMTGDCLRVHSAFAKHGPCTTLQLAERSGISPWSVRPRTTQLLQVGLVELVGKDGREGVYQWVSPAEALERRVRAREPRAEQMALL